MTQSKSERTAGYRSAEQNRRREEGKSSENTKGVENHQRAAECFALASKNHYEAARYHEEGDDLNASKSTILAMGYALMGNEYQSQDVKHHAMEGK